jgi:hypothetical protein
MRLTDSQFAVLATLGKVGGSMQATKGRAFPEGLNGNAVGRLKRMGFVVDVATGHGVRYSMTPKGRAAWVREHAPRARAARVDAASHTMDMCPSGGCNTCDANPYDRSP